MAMESMFLKLRVFASSLVLKEYFSKEAGIEQTGKKDFLYYTTMS
jgi:hypothetical protein